MRNKKVLFITQAALIAALYVVLSMVSASFNLASGSIQMRLSEMLCVLPYFTPVAIPGLFVGCFVFNLMGPIGIGDLIFGSLATLIGAVGTYMLRKHSFACTLPPVIANATIIPLVLIYFYKVPSVIFKGVDLTYLFNVFTVGAGEIVTVCILGSIFIKVLKPYSSVIFKGSSN